MTEPASMMVMTSVFAVAKKEKAKAKMTKRMSVSIDEYSIHTQRFELLKSLVRIVKDYIN